MKNPDPKWLPRSRRLHPREGALLGTCPLGTCELTVLTAGNVDKLLPHLGPNTLTVTSEVCSAQVPDPQQREGASYATTAPRATRLER